ncbi:MAG: ROK family protein [Acidimicrobiales bacterium]|nr:ROK family protein [Acidimicrobiales bacterium]
MAAISVGVDLGGTKVFGVAVDPESAQVVATRRTSTPSSGAEIVSSIVQMVEELAGEAQRPLGSVGIGAAGLVDARGVLRFAPNLPGVVDLDLAGAVGSRVEAPVAVDNDATCSAVAEHRTGAARGTANAIVVALGTGIGGALIMDGEVRRGANHMAGEFGHLLVDPDGPPCGCGNRGCWEQYASGSALGRLGRDAASSGRAPSLLDRAEGRLDEIDGLAVTAAAVAGDQAAVAVLDDFARWVAVGLAGLVNIVDPELVVMGGGLVRAGDLLLDPVRTHLDDLVMGAAYRPAVPVAPATAGDAAAAVGAALLFAA